MPTTAPNESGWVGDREPTEDDVHQANVLPQVSWLQEYKANLLASIGKTVHTPRLRRLPFRQSIGTPNTCTYPLQQLYDIPDFHSQEELDDLRELFTARFGRQHFLEAYGLPGTRQDQPRVPPHLEVAYAAIGSIAMSLDQGASKADSATRACQLFHAGARYYVVMTETNNLESRSAAAVLSTSLLATYGLLGARTVDRNWAESLVGWTLTMARSLRWHDVDQIPASENQRQRSGLTCYVFLVAIVHSLTFGVPSMVSSQDLTIGMLGASCDVATAYSGLFSINANLSGGSKHPGDALVLLLALTSDTLFVELSSRFMQPVIAVDRAEAGSTLKYPANLIPGSAARECIDIEHRILRALRRWRDLFANTATKETLALSFYLELRLSFPRVDILLRQCGYERGHRVVCGEDIAGLEITQRSVRLAWLVLDHVDVRKRRYESLQAIWLPPALFHCALVIWKSQTASGLGATGSLKALELFAQDLDALPWPCCDVMSTCLRSL